MDLKHKVQDHYYRKNLYDIILNGLKEQNIALDQVKRKDIQGVDEFHVRGAQVSAKIAEYADIRAAKLLDVGCGLGGPARMLRDVYDCEVVGIDICQEFVETARKLSELVKMRDKISFFHADATDMPFEPETFDAVWTQHVQMNIEDKYRLYNEIRRVLKKDGTFIHYEILSKGANKLDYPVPWADTDEISYLSTKEELERILHETGLLKIKTEDETEEGIIFFENLLANVRKNGPPKIGLNLLMGEKTIVKINNLLSGLKNGAIELQSGIFIKK